MKSDAIWTWYIREGLVEYDSDAACTITHEAHEFTEEVEVIIPEEETTLEQMIPMFPEMNVPGTQAMAATLDFCGPMKDVKTVLLEFSRQENTDPVNGWYFMEDEQERMKEKEGKQKNSNGRADDLRQKDLKNLHRTFRDNGTDDIFNLFSNLEDIDLELWDDSVENTVVRRTRQERTLRAAKLFEGQMKAMREQKELVMSISYNGVHPLSNKFIRAMYDGSRIDIAMYGGKDTFRKPNSKNFNEILGSMSATERYNRRPDLVWIVDLINESGGYNPHRLNNAHVIMHLYKREVFIKRLFYNRMKRKNVFIDDYLRPIRELLGHAYKMKRAGGGFNDTTVAVDFSHDRQAD